MLGNYQGKILSGKHFIVNFTFEPTPLHSIGTTVYVQHFCSALFYVVIVVLLPLYFVIVQLACMSRSTTTSDRVRWWVGGMSGNSTMPGEQSLCLVSRDSSKSRHKMAKNAANFCENRKNHGKDTASNHGPEDHKTQDLALTTIMTCSARFSSVKFCRCSKIQR